MVWEPKQVVELAIVLAVRFSVTEPEVAELLAQWVLRITKDAGRCRWCWEFLREDFRLLLCYIFPALISRGWAMLIYFELTLRPDVANSPSIFCPNSEKPYDPHSDLFSYNPKYFYAQTLHKFSWSCFRNHWASWLAGQGPDWAILRSVWSHWQGWRRW